MKLIEMFERRYRVHRTLSRGSEAAYRSVIASLAEFLNKAPLVTDLTDEVIQNFTHWLLETRSRKLSRASINRILRTLAALARFAYRRKLIDARLDIEKVPEKRQRPIAWKPKEFERLLKAVLKIYGNNPIGMCLLAVLLVIYDTGLRVIDALSIAVKDCDLLQGVVAVTEKKTGKRRQYRLHVQTLAAVYRARQMAKSPFGGGLIPYPYKETNPLRNRLRKALRVAGLPNDRRSQFQMIRRTTASLAAAAGLDATEVLGHSARHVTLQFYLDRDALPPLDIAGHLPRPLPDQLGSSPKQIEPDKSKLLPPPEASAAEPTSGGVELPAPRLRDVVVPRKHRRLALFVTDLFKTYLGHEPTAEDMSPAVLADFVHWMGPGHCRIDLARKLPRAARPLTIGRKSASKYRGVSRHWSGKWQARIKIAKGKQKYLGQFADEVEAAKAFDAEARRLGRIESLNFPDDDEGCEPMAVTA
jgi:integrase